MTSAVIGALRVNLGIDTAQFTEGLKGVQASMQRIGKQMQNVGATLSTYVTAPLALAGGAIAAAASGLARDVDELRKAAQISNVGFEEFQKLAYAAKSVGIEGDKLADIFKDVNDRIGDFNQTGGGPMADFFENIAPKVGITAEAFKDLSGPQALQLYYDSLKKAGASQQQMTFYLEAMASDATALIPLLEQGGEGFRMLGEGASVISEEQAAGLKAYNDAMRSLSEALKGLTIAIATSGLLEFVTSMVHQLTAVVQAVSEANPALLQWGTVIAGLAAILGPLLAGVGLFVTAVAAISAPVLAAVAGITALVAAGVALYANWDEITARFPIIQQVITTAVEVIKISLTGLLENARLMATGIVQLLSGDFSGAWTTARELVHNFWQTLGGVMNEVLPGFTQGISQIMAAVQQFVTDMVNAFLALPAKMIEIGGQIIDGLWQGIQARWESVKGNIVGLANGITDSVKATLGIRSPSRVMAEIGTYVVQGLANGIGSTQGQAVAAAQGVSSAVTGAFDGMQSIGNSIASTLSSAFQGLIDGSKSVKDVIRDLLSQLASMWMNKAFQALLGGGMGGGGGGFFGTLLSGIGSIFGFARGGTIMPGGAGGIDSQLVMFRKSPNERVDVTKPGQTLTSGRAGVADVRVYVEQDGNWQAAVERISDERVSKAAPSIVGQANSMVVPTMGRFQSDKAGSDYRNG
jgi:phage-related protein